MKNITMHVLTKMAIIFFLYFLVYYTFQGFITIPQKGDGLDYHIPIAKFILYGQFLNPIVERPQQYYPGSSEAILSVFMLFNIPLNLSNVLAWVILLFSTWYLGRIFGLKKMYALLFAITICTLNAIMRWLNAPNIDLWLSIFFILCIILLERPVKKVSYFLKLGFVFGMLIGTKYTGVFFGLVLFIFYIKSLIKYINFRNILAFIIPFSILGLFWYVRNFILMANPFYPMHVLFFKGALEFPDRVWSIFLRYPIQQINAFISTANK